MPNLLKEKYRVFRDALIKNCRNKIIKLCLYSKKLSLDIVFVAFL